MGLNYMSPLTCEFFFNKCVLQYYKVSTWLNPQMWNCTYGGLTVKLYEDFQLQQRVGAPNMHIVQGSTVY